MPSNINKQPQALILLASGFEELEAIAPADILRRAGVSVTMASVEENLHLTGRNDLHVNADMLLETALEESSFDAVIIPGGPGHKTLRGHSTVIELLQKQARRGGLLAAICAGPTVLLQAGLLNDRKYTAHSTVSEELPDSRDEAVVIDGNIITSRGAGTAVEFGLAIAAYLKDEETAQSVAESIHYPSTPVFS